MKPDLRSLKSACPEVDERFLKEHRQRLSDTYFSSFPEKEIHRHVRGLAGLSPERPLEVLRTLHSFDPCLACAIHLVDKNRNEIVKVKVL